MEDVRNILCKMYEESTGQKAAPHQILFVAQETTKALSDVDTLRKASSQCVRQLKEKLARRQDLIQRANGRTNTEIATLTIEIDKGLKQLQQTIESIE